MTIDHRLESYLSSLEQVLKPLPVSERAEIVTEIKSHVLSALERDPNSQLDTVLRALGEPETVANRYLMERGMKPAKPPISPIVRWIVIGFLGTFAMFLIFLGVVMMKFSPLVHVDEKNEQVSLLGGLIRLDGNGQVSSDMYGWNIGGSSESFEGAADLASGRTLDLNFTNGKIEVTNSDDQKVHWECKARVDHGGAGLEPKTSPTGLVMDWGDVKGIKCNVNLPADIKFNVKGSNGKLEINSPHYDVDLALANGKVELRPDSAEHYKYDINVTNGRVDSFDSSDAPNARHIAIRVVNGKISRGE